MTLLAGRLTPAARVEVAHSTDTAPHLYARSTRSRSSELSPGHTGKQGELLSLRQPADTWGVRSRTGRARAEPQHRSPPPNSDAAEHSQPPGGRRCPELPRGVRGWRAVQQPAQASCCRAGAGAPAWWKATPRGMVSSSAGSAPPGILPSSSQTDARVGCWDSSTPFTGIRHSDTSTSLQLSARSAAHAPLGMLRACPAYCPMYCSALPAVLSGAPLEAAQAWEGKARGEVGRRR